jgi:hypothetical protein
MKVSNCDHKLITRLYNNRILKVIEDKISQLTLSLFGGVGSNPTAATSIIKDVLTQQELVFK